MASSDSIFRHLFAILIGILISFFAGILAGLIWSPLQWPIFGLLLLCWIAFALDAIRRQQRSANIVASATTEPWQVEKLPEEFRFIDRATTLKDIAERIGPHTRVRGDGEIRALQYDLPYQAAVLVFAKPPFKSQTKVCGVEYYRNRNDVALFP